MSADIWTTVSLDRGPVFMIEDLEGEFPSNSLVFLYAWQMRDWLAWVIKASSDLAKMRVRVLPEGGDPGLWLPVSFAHTRPAARQDRLTAMLTLGQGLTIPIEGPGRTRQESATRVEATVPVSDGQGTS